MASAPYHAYHDLGIEKRRADIVRRLATEAVRLDRLASVTSGEAGAALGRFRGVGEWTVAETVAVSHGDADALSVGDFHLKHLVSWHLAGRPRGTDEEMVELLEPFRPHRGRVVRLLESAGRYPSYGPRQPLRSFAGY
jgi:3-methyladenine DNA glycosylase/8-oxoguanine DNA glycosylase